MCDACSTCAQYGRSSPQEPMKSLPIATGPWQIVSQDFCELEKQRYLVTACHFSDWIEVDKLEDTLSPTAIEKTKVHFVKHGVPAICHTDNEPHFISKDYRKFPVEYGFTHTTSPLYHPKGKGRAEAAVKVAESNLKKADDFHSAMLIYKKTPSPDHTSSPAQRMLLRRTRTTLPTTDQLLTPTMLNCRIVEEEISKKRRNSKTYHDKSASVEQGQLIIGTYAYAKPPPHQHGQPLVYGEAINHENPRSYTIRAAKGCTIRRKRAQLKPVDPPSCHHPRTEVETNTRSTNIYQKPSMETAWCSFAVSVDEKVIVVIRVQLIRRWLRPPAWKLQSEPMPVCRPLTVKVEV